MIGIAIGFLAVFGLLTLVHEARAPKTTCTIDRAGHQLCITK